MSTRARGREFENDSHEDLEQEQGWRARYIEVYCPFAAERARVDPTFFGPADLTAV